MNKTDEKGNPAPASTPSGSVVFDQSWNLFSCGGSNASKIDNRITTITSKLSNQISIHNNQQFSDGNILNNNNGNNGNMSTMKPLSDSSSLKLLENTWKSEFEINFTKCKQDTNKGYKKRSLEDLLCRLIQTDNILFDEAQNGNLTRRTPQYLLHHSSVLLKRKHMFILLYFGTKFP